jgi:hypothetical protein
MIKFTLNNTLGGFYTLMAVLGLLYGIFVDANTGILITMTAFLGKILENTATLVDHLKGLDNE